MTCLVLSFLLISIDHSQRHLESIRAGLSIVVYPVQMVIDTPVAWLRSGLDYLSSRRRLLIANESLREENDDLRFRMLRYEALEQENRRLRELLDTSYLVGDKVQVARLLAVASNPSSQEVVINKGAWHGVYSGQPILDAKGILGHIVHVGPFSSHAMLISDARHAIPVTVNRSGVRGIVEGADSDTSLKLSFVPNNADVQPGDLLVSSGMGGIFPQGYPVGEIEHVDIDPAEAFAKITVAPISALGSTREVLLVWPQNAEVAESSQPGREPPLP